MQIVLPELPDVLQVWRDLRRRRGADLYDYVIDGTYYVQDVPSGLHARVQATLMTHVGNLASGLVALGPFNLGDHSQNYVVSKFGLVAAMPDDDMYLPTAELVGEVLSPNDRAPEKFGFYLEHGVKEILMIDPAQRTVEIWVAVGDQYLSANQSNVVDVTVEQLVEVLGWAKK